MPFIAPSFVSFLFIIFLVVYFLSSAIKILKEYERGVVFRLGRIIPVKGPGLVLIWPIIDKLVKVSLRTITMDVPAQDIITKDNISVKVNAVVYFRHRQLSEVSLDRASSMNC
jgi:regulator of protease activity HflC (stomatin/prohibitin superfamily)